MTIYKNYEKYKIAAKKHIAAGHSLDHSTIQKLVDFYDQAKNLFAKYEGEDELETSVLALDVINDAGSFLGQLLMNARLTKASKELILDKVDIDPTYLSPSDPLALRLVKTHLSSPLNKRFNYRYVTWLVCACTLSHERDFIEAQNLALSVSIDGLINGSESNDDNEPGRTANMKNAAMLLEELVASVSTDKNPGFMALLSENDKMLAREVGDYVIIDNISLETGLLLYNLGAQKFGAKIIGLPTKLKSYNALLEKETILDRGLRPADIKFSDRKMDLEAVYKYLEESSLANKSDFIRALPWHSSGPPLKLTPDTFRVYLSNEHSYAVVKIAAHVVSPEEGDHGYFAELLQEEYVDIVRDEVTQRLSTHMPIDDTLCLYECAKLLGLNPVVSDESNSEQEISKKWFNSGDYRYKGTIDKYIEVFGIDKVTKASEHFIGEYGRYGHELIDKLPLDAVLKSTKLKALKLSSDLSM